MADRDAAVPAEDLNPYASPSVVQDAPLRLAVPFVDGRCIVVPSRADLPQRCIFTNEVVLPTDRKRRRLDWAPSFHLVLRHRHCYLSYCVNHEIRHRQSCIRILLSVAGMGLIWLLLGNRFLWVLPVVPLVIAAVPMDSVRVVAHRDGQFWITGFSDAFLRSCAQQYGATRREDHSESHVPWS